MKIVHKKTDTDEGPGNGLGKAKKLEQEGELDKAAAAFEKLVKEQPLNEYAYNRLMIIYRKRKEHKKELSVIKRGMHAFEQSFKSASKIKVTKKITTLSRSLLKSLGMADKKGNSLYKGEPFDRWNKRKTVVERLIKKQVRK